MVRMSDYNWGFFPVNVCIIVFILFPLLGAIICCTIVDRLQSDQITATHEELEAWQTRPQQIVANYIRKKLGKM